MGYVWHLIINRLTDVEDYVSTRQRNLRLTGSSENVRRRRIVRYNRKTLSFDLTEASVLYLFMYMVSRHNMIPPMTTPIATPIATANRTPATSARKLQPVASTTDKERKRLVRHE